MSKILITGGCGFIGSHLILELIEQGFNLISIDNFSNSKRQIYKILKTNCKDRFFNYNIDLSNPTVLSEDLSELNEVDILIHLAASKSVVGSFDSPLNYYRNNINCLINSLRLAEKYEINKLIFSSSSSVYGNINTMPVLESTPRSSAKSPYARTKQICEDILFDYSKSNVKFTALALRYFNPCGAHPMAKIGESSLASPSNLIPVIMEVGMGKREKITIHGNDYPTRDGTCIRDYIHIMDLVSAHFSAVKYLLSNKQEKGFDVINLGAGKGYSVKEMVDAFESTTKQSLHYEYGPRRPGDIMEIFCDHTKAEKLLGWVPKYGIDSIMRDAWAWENKKTC